MISMPASAANSPAVSGRSSRMFTCHPGTAVGAAFVEASSDWRSLNKLAVENGHLRDYLILPERRSGHLGVIDWHEPAGTVAGESLPTNGKFSVADPRHPGPAKHNNEFRIVPWD